MADEDKELQIANEKHSGQGFFVYIGREKRDGNAKGMGNGTPFFETI